MTPTYRGWLAGLISLALHAAILVPLTLVPAPRSLSPGQPLALEAVIVEEEPLSLLGPPPERVVSIQLLPASSPSRPAPRAPAVDPLPPELAASGPIRPVGDAEGTPGSASGADGGRGTGAGPVGPARSSSMFPAAVGARRVVYVIDRSVSMGLNGALEQVKRELLASLERLPADALFQIVVYNRTAQPLVLNGAVGMASPTSAIREKVADQLDSLQAEGATEHLPALSLALSYDADVIYFLTDADDLRPDQVRLVTGMNHGRAAIHTIELTTVNASRRDMPLQILARENRGTYRAVALR